MEDKIMNNSYNTGNYNYEELTGSIRVDHAVSSLYEDQLGDNIDECHIDKLLNDEFYKIFENSIYYEKYKGIKKIDKGDLLKMYYHFKTELIKHNKFTISAIFMTFAEFFNANYEILYNELGMLDKETILKELNEKYQLTSKFKYKKLF